jgi:hypothetical protein
MRQGKGIGRAQRTLPFVRREIVNDRLKARISGHAPGVGGIA